MKKTVLALAALAIAFTGCQKDSDGGASFSKASVIVEVTNSDGSGAVTGDFWDYVSFDIKGLDFNGASFTSALNASKSSYSITTQNKPTKDKSYTASIKVTPVLSANIPDKMNVDFCIKVYGVIYDTKGNVIRTLEQRSIADKGSCNGSEFKDDFKSVLTSSTFELCYVQSYSTSEWMYNFGITPWSE